jgi:aminopeptidase
MITREKIVKCAEAIVDSMNLKRGENVFVRGGTHAQELLEEIGYLCYMKGAIPLISATSDNFKARTLTETATEILAITPRHLLAAVKEIDAYITVEPFKDPAVQTRIPNEKLGANVNASVPIRKVLYGEEGNKGKKWVYAGWPTLEAARFYGIDYEDLERLIIDGMMVSASVLKRNCSVLAERLKGVDMVHVTDSKGTDFTCKVKGRRINEDDGFISEEDIKMNDLGNNLPAGEVFIAPHENFGEGTIYCPVTIDRLSNKIVRGVTLHFKDGKLLLDECTAEKNEEQMLETFKRCLEIDKREKEIRTTNIGEFAIGCNPAIDKAIGYILTDEKIGGTVHVAFGNNLGYGGTSSSSMHWDFVTYPDATVEIVDTGKLIMKDGKIL